MTCDKVGRLELALRYLRKIPTHSRKWATSSPPMPKQISKTSGLDAF